MAKCYGSSAKIICRSVLFCDSRVGLYRRSVRLKRSSLRCDLGGKIGKSDFQNAQPESATTCHHRTEQKDPPRRKVLLKIAPVLVHQAPLRLGHVLHEGRALGDQFEEVVLLCHSRENSSSRLQQCPEFRELPHLEILPARNAYHLQ
jgi:hypothetical protein